MKTNQTPAVPKFPLVRVLPDTDRQRNLSITVNKLEEMEIAPCPGFSIVMYFEGFTGVRWMPIINKDEAFSLDRAIEIAKEMRKSLGM